MKAPKQVMSTVKSVTDRKSISNEKIKTRRIIDPDGTGLSAVVNFKTYTDQKDPLLIFAHGEENGPYVFKTSSLKMRIARNANVSSEHFLYEEFIYFDGKHGRCHDRTTLTASIYDPLLKKQISLAVLECHTEDSNTVQLFWELFVRAYETENGLASTFDPRGWITDMAGANIEGLKRVFGVQAVQKIKGCEWHYKDGVNKHAHRLSDCGATFKPWLMLCWKQFHLKATKLQRKN